MPSEPDPSPHNRFVFHDPSGRRAKRASLAGGFMLSFLAAIVAGFLATLALAPQLPVLRLQDPRILQGLHQETAKHLRGRPAWTQVRRPRTPGTGKAIRPLTVGFYVSWDADSRQSLKEHVNAMDVVAPAWIFLKDQNGGVDITDDPEAAALITSASHPPAVIPLIQNFRQETWVGALGDSVILNRAAGDALIASLIKQADKHGYAGYMFDLENLSPQAVAAYPAFLDRARAALKPLGREVWATAPFDDDSWQFRKIQDACDTLVLMAYDQHYATGDPGPPAGQVWFEKVLDDRLSGLDPDKTVMALGSYGYDWRAKDANGQAQADAMTFAEAISLAKDASAPIRMDDNELNPTFSYVDEKGASHTVWFLDATTLFNEIKVTDPWHVRGYAMWRLGTEDPGVWSVFGKPYGRVESGGLSNLAPGEGVDFDGTGEVLSVSDTPKPGKRTLTFDPDTGLIADEHYDVLPSSYKIQRYGAHPGLVALTFDDGPDYNWTPKILKILKEKNAPATFFVIGKNMQLNPSLVKREIDQGMVVGNHTYTHPNIGELPVAETDIELNATQRLFETITGRSMRLLRPPYFGDAEPSTPAEVDPLVAAQKLGYLIAGLRIDPDDWKKPDPTLIVQRSLTRLADPDPETGGQVILLHDSGGDRSRTVEALPNLIDQLRAHGYRLVTMAELAGMTPDQAMPESQRDWLSLTLDRIGFSIFRWIDFFLRTLFVSAIVLGVLRLIFLAVLASVHRIREPGRKPQDLDPQTGPLVSVLIPCFNEEKVIAASVARILDSNWSRLEVLVLDDGSSDNTSAEVEKHFAGDPRVTLLRFENGGKALALNRGLDLVKGEIVVALDADTLFPPATIGRLARWFVDPRVGAVAGNALVGNRGNLITRWQALE